MKTKRLLCLICSAAMALSLSGYPMTGYGKTANIAAAAEDERVEKTTGDWSYYDYTGMVALSAYHGTAVNITIPGTIDGKTVYRIYPQVFQNNDKVESITIPKSIQIIADDAFVGCSSLKSFHTSANGFYQYSAGMLYHVEPELSETTHTVGTGDWTSSVMDYKKTLVYCTKDSAYITVPEGVGAIGGYAFANHEKLTHIVLPAGIQYIGDHAFQNCTKLRGMSMTSGEAGNSEFNIPFGTIAIGSYAFSGCEDIRTVNFPNTLEFIGANAFRGTSIQSAYIPPSVAVIEPWAFNWDITVIGDPKSEDDEGTENVAALYAANNYSRYTTTGAYQGGGYGDDGSYQIVDANGNIITINMNVTHDPNNDLDHNYVYTACVPVTCTTPGAIAGICYCGHTFYQEFPALGHAFTEEVTVPPTCTEDGYTGMKCIRCDAVYEKGSGLIDPVTPAIPDKQVIPATGHSYGAPVYEWSEDHTACTARSYCEHDESHILMDIGTVTSKKDGNTTIYTAVFNNKSFATQTIRVTGGIAEPVTEPTTEPSPEPATGDANGDGDFGVADILQVQKWMLGRPDTGLANWKAVDFYPDGVIDVFDLALMKRALIYGKHPT